MISSTVSALLIAALAVSATPAKRATAPTDIDILNYALTLEHLENAFYSGALAKFDNATFNSAGLDRALFEQISEHEATHVAFLTTALGNNATAACNYSFPYTDAKSFAALSMVLEGVGVSAYLGAAALIQNTAYLTAAGAILTTESRHAAWVSSVADGQEPWSGALDVPLSLNEVFSLAAPFITSCPSSNPTLPVKAFPTLNVTSSNYTAGGPLSLSFNNTASQVNASSLFVSFFSGLTQTTTPYNNGSVTIPQALNASGTVYALLLNQNATATDDNTVAGPVILMFPNQTTTVTNSSGASNTTAVKSNAAPVGVRTSVVGSIIGALVGAVALAL